jgi:hypothetical protein
LRRHSELVEEYKCSIYLIGIRAVPRQHDEKKLHTALKNNYPQNIETIKIGKTEKTEVYRFSIPLFDQFNAVGEYINTITKIKQNDESRAIINSIKSQEIHFSQENIITFDQSIIIQNINNPEVVKLYFETCAKIQINRDNNTHQLVMLNRKAEIDRDKNAHELAILNRKAEINKEKHERKIDKKNKNKSSITVNKLTGTHKKVTVKKTKNNSMKL